MSALEEVLRSIHLAGSVYCRSELRAPWGMSIERADHGSFHTVRQGRCWIRVDSLGEAFELSPGDLVVLPHGHPHALSDTPGTSAVPIDELLARKARGATCPLEVGGDGPLTTLICGYFRFQQGSAHPLLSLLPPLIRFEGEGGRALPGFDDTLDALTRETLQGGPGAETIMTRLTDVLFIQVLRAHLERIPDEDRSWLRGLRDPQIGRALGLVHGQPERAWTVESLAVSVGMSRASFAELFRRLVGDTPLQYLTRWRMQRAAELLSTEDLPLATVAHRVGYSAESAFSKVFKKFVGEAPGRYRRRFHGSGGAGPPTMEPSR